ncbi:MAG: hypothetical protein WD489_07930 [Rhodovibrionaceae bacterium]
MTFMTVRLELARSEDFPEGSAAHGYEFRAPLDAEGHIDAEAWREHRKHCRVWRFWEGENDEFGHLVHHRGGWSFHYDIQGDAENDETGFRFDTHSFKEGEYVTLREQDGDTHTFRVVSVRPGPPHAKLLLQQD